MGQNLRVWRENARRKLKEQLGNRCVDCGVSVEVKPLMFAHVIPLTNEQHEHRCKIGSNSRLCLYRKEAKEGLICLRCQSCNVKQAREPKQGFLCLISAAIQTRVDAPF